MLDTPATHRAIQELALACTSDVVGQPAVALDSLPLQLMREDILAHINGAMNASGVNVYMGLLQVF